MEKRDYNLTREDAQTALLGAGNVQLRCGFQVLLTQGEGNQIDYE